MRTKFKIGLWVMLSAIVAFIVFAAAPPPGTYIVPSFFTTNAAKIYGTNGVGVSSNTALGIYLIDGRNLTNGLSGSSISTFSNNVSLTSATTNYDFYNFLAMTQANGKVSIGTTFQNLSNNGYANFAGPVAIYSGIFSNLGTGIRNSGWQQNNNVLTQATAAYFTYFDTASEVLRSDPAGLVTQIPNGTGALTNDNTGNFGWFNGYVTTDTRGISLQTNAFGGTVGSATNLVIGTTSNVVVTATNTATGNGTNSVWFDTAQPITTKSSPTFENIGITKDASVSNHLAIGAINSATNYFAPFKTRFFALTNATGGWGDWMAGMPMLSRRNWFAIADNGAGVSALGCQSAASIGSLVNAEGSTNEWPAFSYTTGAANLSSNGIIAATSATQLSMHPGKNLYFSFVGRISQMSTQRMWIGLTSATSATMGADSDTPTSSHIAMIRLSSAASGALTNWALVTCDGSACTATAAGPVSLTTTNVHVFEIMEDRPNTRWLAYVDGTVIATNSANLPASGMHYCVIISTKEAVAKTFRGSVIYGEQDNRIDGNIVLNYP